VFKITYESIVLEKYDSLARIIFNRPEKLNAISSTMSIEIKRAFSELASDDRIRTVVVTGNPRIREKDGRQEIRHCFSVGCDLSEAAAVEPITEMIAEFGKPVIAMINGYAFGGGYEIALACDFIIASDNAEIGMPEIKRGLMPGWGGTQRLPRRIGAARAKWMIFTGDTVNGAEAAAIGLVDWLVKREELDQFVTGLALKIASGPPLGLAKIKETIDTGIGKDLPEALKIEQEALKFLLQTEDFREGINAFMEKRNPNWKGR